MEETRTKSSALYCRKLSSKDGKNLSALNYKTFAIPFYSKNIYIDIKKYPSN